MNNIFVNRSLKATLLVILMFSIAGIMNVHAAVPENGLPPFLKGNQISVRNTAMTIPANQPCYISHGWLCNDWNTLTSDQRRDALSGYSFELYVDGVRVDLRKWTHFYPDGTSLMNYNMLMNLAWYVQFAPNTFSPGSIQTFEGIYYDHSTHYSFTCEVTFS